MHRCFHHRFCKCRLNLCSEQRPGHLLPQRLAGNIFSAEEAYSYYEEQYGSGEAEENRLQYEMLFWNDHGEGQMESAELGRLSTGDIVYTCGRTDLLIPDALRLDYDDFGLCILGKTNCMGIVWDGSGRRSESYL